MNYEEFKQLLRPHDKLYNIVRISDNKDILRGASVKSVEEMADLVGSENIKIFIY
jgi:hypothetical protein